MRKYLTLLVAAFLLASCGSKPKYVISGNVAGVEGKVYLSYMEGKMPAVVDSTEAVEGKFVFKGTTALPILAQIRDDKRFQTVFLLENSEISVTGSADDPRNIKVEGSAENDLFMNFSQKLQGAESKEAYISTAENIVKSNPGSVAAAYVLLRWLTPYIDYGAMREYAAGFDSALQNSVYLRLVEERAQTLEATSPGRKFVDFMLPDTEGNPVAFSSVAGQGKWVLLDFWASWCGPCRAENPHVVEAYNKFKDKGFTVFGVSLDHSKEDWIKAIDNDKLFWTNVSDLQFWNCAPAAAYGVSSIPSNLLIAPDGTIMARNLRGRELIDRLEKELGGK